MNTKNITLLFLLLIFSHSTLASSLVLGVGAAEGRDDKHHTVIDLGLEGNELQSFLGLKPYANVFLADETYYVGAGLIKEFELSQRWQLGFGATVGYYDTDEESLELGHDVEFKTKIYIGYAVMQGHKIRVEYGHISNADLGNDNPGMNMALIDWVIDF
ncbi:acyloxyacyl hydrolase [Marinobacterium jannaschii]|uniref:acyloxyacyl hydrolase n=1 Tax=Marinobacterium jannaschii TaxID=64970 RepID=UPI0004838862|nr:acyloxyacyl hydrolase [Marinobacterium jannaschii]